MTPPRHVPTVTEATAARLVLATATEAANDLEHHLPAHASPCDALSTRCSTAIGLASVLLAWMAWLSVQLWSLNVAGAVRESRLARIEADVSAIRAVLDRRSLGQELGINRP